LAGGRTGLIGAIASFITPGFLVGVVGGINRVVTDNRCNILFSVGLEDESYASVVNRFCANRLVDGLILVAPRKPMFDEPLPINDIPVVLCAGREYRRKSPWYQVPSVVTDNHAAMQEMMSFLAREGHRSFLYIGGPKTSHDAKIREQGVRAFLKQHSGLRGEFIGGAQSVRRGVTYMKAYLKKLGRRPIPDAIVCFNDALALGVIETLEKVGIRSGRDITVTGLDDDPAAEVVGLTTLRQPMWDLGMTAAKTLFKLLDRSRGAKPPELRTELHMTLVPRRYKKKKAKKKAKKKD
jgi:DNA-binding LacI/PurR family transcriptional regulator